MATERGLDRLTFFTDAVVIPAVTFYALLVLLITPLLDPLLAAFDRRKAARV